MEKFDLSNCKIDQLIIHRVGNKTQEEPLITSDLEIDIEQFSTLDKGIQSFFLKKFKPGAFYHFDKPENEDENEMIEVCTAIFDSYDQFVIRTKRIAELLFQASTHPKIKGGDLFIAKLRDLVIDGDVVDAIGIFKTEHKDQFIQVTDEQNAHGGFDIYQLSGVELSKLDKGALIINAEKEKGFKIMLKDIPVSGVEALYFKESFLQLKDRPDVYYQTSSLMNLTNDFVMNVFSEQHGVEFPAQVDLLNRSLKYFKDEDYFNVVEFENNVLEEPVIIEAFQDHREAYQEEGKGHFYDEFTISDEAVKKQKGIFKRVIELDRKISLNINGNEQNLEKGFDGEKNMNYVTIFYNEELQK
ncbi:nucleoid-associated protein [Flammeovirga sp. SJP92]|uniref:nucleoid-associated protein n=1 Tax=Flammeovirga sp. SJP92 TaxID=1775430 RepID=UPI000788E70B|nr:nucleoid-associated protein [Flammeovirga sp. SJP92]KXX72741.1 hypothetical protein AVL50_32085 [Flammeovirga sp. SJP92]